MEGSAGVDGGAAGREFAGNGGTQVNRIGFKFQSGFARIIVDWAMGHDFKLMGAWNKMHAAVLGGRGLERHPDAEAGVFLGRIPIRFVLVPWSRRGVVRRFVDGVITHHHGLGSEQLLHDRFEIADELSVEKFGGEFGGLQ